MDGEAYDREERGDPETHRYPPDPQPDDGSGGHGGTPTTYGSYEGGRFRASESDSTAERFLPVDPEPRRSPYGPPPGYHQATFGQPPADPGYGPEPAGYDPPRFDPSRLDRPYTQSGYTAYPPPQNESSRYDVPTYERASYGAVPETAPAQRDPFSSYGYGIDPSPSQEIATRASHRRAGTDDDETEDARPADESTRRSMPLWQELPLLLVVAFCLAVLIRTFLLQAFYIPSGSMENTLLVGDRVLVNKIVYDVRTPERGEVIVFRGTDNWAPENPVEPPGSLLSRIGRTLGDLVGVSRPGEKDFIKRVIGLPGDRVSCCDADGRVFVNGQPMDEPYVQQNSPLEVEPDPRVCRSRRFDEVVVPAGQLFVMGDHRIVSQDSRCQGTVPIENIIGRAFVIVWPSSRWDTLGVPDNFASVPGPVAIGLPGSGPPTIGLQLATAAVTMPVLASLVVTTRSGRKRRWARRTLRK